MADYDPQVLVAFSERLYWQAGFIVFRYAVLGLLFGILASVVIGVVAAQLLSANAIIMVLLVLLVVGTICTVGGYLAGQDRALALKLQAQTVLCQVQIERNTRGYAAQGR